MAKLTQKQAIDLVSKFSRTGNFPQDEQGVRNMADGLAKAARGDFWMAEKIVESLRQTAAFCPSDANFFQAAEGIRSEHTYKRLDEQERRCPLSLCDGSGWIPVEKHGISAVKACGCRASATAEPERKPAGGLRRPDGAMRAAGERE